MMEPGTVKITCPIKGCNRSYNIENIVDSIGVTGKRTLEITISPHSCAGDCGCGIVHNNKILHIGNCRLVKRIKR